MIKYYSKGEIMNKEKLINVDDLYVCIYYNDDLDARINDRNNFRKPKYIKIGLFKKTIILDTAAKDPNVLRFIQVYVDQFNNNTMGLYLDRYSGKDVTVSGAFKSEGLLDLPVLSADYIVSPYSDTMDNLQDKYGIKKFTVEEIIPGLVKLSDFAPELKGEVPVSSVIKTLMSFNNKVLSGNFNSRKIFSVIKEPKIQIDILTSLIELQDFNLEIDRTL
jgi:hypothetical protein